MKTCGNRNYRKWLALMVSGGLAVTALAGCGGSDGGTEQSAQTEVSEGIKTAAEDNKVTTFALLDGSEESEIYVEPIADLPDDFIRGMDASAVLSLECEFPYKSRVMGTSEPLKPLKAPYMARNPVKWGFFRLKGQEIPLKI